MSDCCSSQKPEKIKRHSCPVHGQLCLQVAVSTIIHHLKSPWEYPLKDQAYYFCDDPGCDVVYFGEDDSVINKQLLRTVVGIKQQTDDAVICYCFGVSKSDAMNNPVANAFVIEQTKQGVCACATRNPSGRCCLKDFPK
ncbi:MAG: hypothetical protein OEY43_06800 [Gammaproteobacteria bacterium]|nr:hypothetical protein [Gammaproteobacteria bacterium]